MGDDNVPEKLLRARSKSPSNKEKAKEGDARSSDKDKGAREVDPRNNEKDLPGKGQRYYLYDQELKRPIELPPGFRGAPRGFRGRLPFHMHDYHGIYPTNEDAKFELELRARREREQRIYSRPPDIYHNTPRSPPRFERSERYEHDRRSDRRGDYDSYSRRHYDGGSCHSPSSRRHWDDRDRDSHYYDHSRSKYEDYGSSSHRKSDAVLNGSSRDYYSSSTLRRRHSYEESVRSRTPSPKPNSSKVQPNPKEKESNDFDLDIELHPLMHFIDDKPRLLKEALSILKGKKLDAMIPHVFSHLNPREIQEVCLQELNNLNIATIANVIDGKLVNAELANPPLKARKSKKSGGVSVKKIKKKLKEANTEDVSIKKKRKVGADGNPSKPKKLKKEKKHKKKKKKSKELKADEVPLGPGLPPQKTLMELLELEYRAKAIKALLKNQDINSLSSQIDDALLGDPEPSSVTPSVALPPVVPTVIEPPPPPEINTRFLVDNTYIYPMQIKLELEDPPDDLEEGQFPPSPPATTTTAETLSEIVPAALAASPVDSSPPELSQSETEPILLTQPATSDSQPVDAGIMAPSDTSATCDTGQPEDAPTLPSLTDQSVVEGVEAQGPEVPVPIVAVTETEAGVIPEVTNSVPDSEPPKPRIQIVITLDDDTDDDDDEVSGDENGGEAVTGRVDDSAVPCMNGDVTAMDTEPVESEESELEEGEYGDAAEEQAVGGAWREKGQESEAELEREEDEESLDEEFEEPPLNTYVRRSSDLPVIAKSKDRDLSPPRLPLVKIRPEPPAISRAFPEAEDISSDDSSGLEPLGDDGIVIGGDPVSDTDDPITIPPPVHTCQPRPEGYEEVSENSNMGDEEEEEEDEETNPRTWFNRWYNSKKVQKNVKSNKMIGKLRTKLRREKAIQEPLPPEPSEEAVPIIGSITEYQTLFSSGKYKMLPENEEQPESAVAEAEKATEDEEAEDDEALWGDIIIG